MTGSQYIYNTDTGHDKMTFDVEGSFSALARYGVAQPRRTIETITHTQESESLPEGFWSLDNVSWYPMGVTPPDTSGAQPTFQTTEVDCYTDTANIYVACSNYTSSAKTIYYGIRLNSRN